MGVDAAGIRVEVGAHYPGRPVSDAEARYGRGDVAPPGNQAGTEKTKVDLRWGEATRIERCG